MKKQWALCRMFTSSRLYRATKRNILPHTIATPLLLSWFIALPTLPSFLWKSRVLWHPPWIQLTHSGNAYCYEFVLDDRCFDLLLRLFALLRCACDLIFVLLFFGLWSSLSLSLSLSFSIGLSLSVCLCCIIILLFFNFHALSPLCLLFEDFNVTCLCVYILFCTYNVLVYYYYYITRNINCTNIFVCYSYASFFLLSHANTLNYYRLFGEEKTDQNWPINSVGEQHRWHRCVTMASTVICADGTITCVCVCVYVCTSVRSARLCIRVCLLIYSCECLTVVKFVVRVMLTHLLLFKLSVISMSVSKSVVAITMINSMILLLFINTNMAILLRMYIDTIGRIAFDFVHQIGLPFEAIEVRDLCVCVWCVIIIIIILCVCFSRYYYYYLVVVPSLCIIIHRYEW